MPYGTWRRVRPAIILALATALSAAGCGDLLTSDGGAGRTNWAVLVGISNYQSPSLNLKWADEDALDVYDTLRHSKHWDTDKITLLTNAAATRDAIKSAIAGLTKRVSADDQVFFYFSGRGSFGPDQPPFDEGDGLDEFLVPYDGLQASSSHDLSDDELEALFAALPTNNVLIVLDAGFASRRGTGSGREKSAARPGSAVGRGVSPRSIDGMAHDLGRPGYVMISASQAGAAPAESSQLRNGVFTHFFVEGLRGAANPGKKTVTAQQAFEYAAPRTSAAATGQLPQMLDNRGRALRVATF